MSIRTMMDVFYESKATANDRLVLLCIADEADEYGTNAFPSIRRLADKANCHTDTVVECIKRLEALGELEVIRPEKQGRGRFNRYTVLVGKLKVGDSVHSDDGLVTGSVEGLARVDPRQSRDQPAPKQGPTRAKNTYPQSNAMGNQETTRKKSVAELRAEAIRNGTECKECNGDGLADFGDVVAQCSSCRGSGLG